MMRAIAYTFIDAEEMVYNKAGVAAIVAIRRQRDVVTLMPAYAPPIMPLRCCFHYVGDDDERYDVYLRVVYATL